HLNCLIFSSSFLFFSFFGTLALAPTPWSLLLNEGDNRAKAGSRQEHQDKNPVKSNARSFSGLFYLLCDEVGTLDWPVALQQLLARLDQRSSPKSREDTVPL
ncbi:hypothetical protein, partial [Paenibacillus macerans]|uniref:hypothetical protein n=1 Tax=Paenibacillus macerans TaxID=44252 RepID=UPI002DDCDE6A